MRVTAHGGNPANGFPRIAGQSQYYIAKQLESYAAGSRQNPIMAPIAKALSPEERDAAAAYYAAQDVAPPKSNAPAQQAQVAERGRILAMTGDNNHRVPACVNCHGPGGIGEPPVYPYLAGLDAAYMTAALNAWRNGTRRNDGGQQMATIANALTPDDIAAVAQHYASLTPPKPIPVTLAQKSGPATKPAPGNVPSSSHAADPRPDKSVGVGQGAATTGGTQGPGAAANRRRIGQETLDRKPLINCPG
ncbi:MAG: c-type cytochrome [Burkholderiales bacterium]